MALCVALSSLPPHRRELLHEMQRLNFGQFEKLVIRNGQPVLNPRPVIVRELKFCCENGPRSEVNSADFALKKQVVEMFALFDELQNGVIDVLEVKHGLPFRMILREVAA